MEDIRRKNGFEVWEGNSALTRGKRGKDGGQVEGLEEAGRWTPKWTGIRRKLRDITDFLGTCISYLLLRNTQQPRLPAQLSALKIIYSEALLCWALLRP